MDVDWSVLGFHGIKDMMNVHPVLVHAPIALLPASLLFYLLGIILKRRSLLVAGRGCLYLGVLGAALAAWSGEAAIRTIPKHDAIHRLMEPHEVLGEWAGKLVWVLAAWSFFQQDHRPKFAPAFLLLLGGITLLIAQVADLGGRLVHVEGAGVRAAAPMIRQIRDAERAKAAGEVPPQP